MGHGCLQADGALRSERLIYGSLQLVCKMLTSIQRGLIRGMPGSLKLGHLQLPELQMVIMSREGGGQGGVPDGRAWRNEKREKNGKS